MEKIRESRVALDNGGSLFITLSFVLGYFAKHPYIWIEILYELYGIFNSVMITVALLSIRTLLSSNSDVQQSHRMMAIHLLIFNIYALALAVNEIAYWTYELGYTHETYWTFAMLCDNFGFAYKLSYCIMLQFIAYLIVKFGNVDDES